MIGAGLIGFVLICFLVMMVLRFTVWGSWNHRMGCGMGGMGGMNGSMDAEEILRQRYARGEITKEQYDQMLRDLRYGRN
ncbi:MAG: SHOCT domain-containing protein [Candidatus Bathyarchaeota archaeon]|nr:SHOCT domain-containing protein [Candidatus Bathyarchaeota archaeon]